MLRLILVAQMAAAQLPTVEPEKIDGIFKFTAGRNSPGCAVGAYRDGKVLFARGYGYADLDRDIPITPTTAFALASVSKQFTAAVVDLLVADGKLSLDDDVRKYVPELPRYQAPITIRHLIHHTSGLRDYASINGLSGRDGVGTSDSATLAILVRQRRLHFTPGEMFAYSNSGYTLLSIIVERVSGKPLHVYAKERLFQPLGMLSTVYRDRIDRPITGRAFGYIENNTTIIPGLIAIKGWKPVEHYGHTGSGGLFSTVEDVARWEGHMLEPRLGNGKWRELTESPGKLNDGSTNYYGAGLFLGTYAGEPMIFHGGGVHGATTQLVRFPRQRFSIAVLCNRNLPTTELANRVAALFIGPDTTPGVQAASDVTMTEPEMRAYTGTFYNVMPGVREVVFDRGKLYYARFAGDRMELLPLGGSRFRIMGGPTLRFLGHDTLKFDPGPASPGSRLIRVVAPKSDLEEYAGTYVSSELTARWTIRVHKKTLIVDRNRGSGLVWEPAFEDGFRGDDFLIVARFIRDQQGRIVAMEINAGDRVQHLWFERER